MSEKTLDSLIKTLKTEAIETAEKEARVIIEAAKEESQRILKDAQEKKKQMLYETQQEAQATLERGESALRQSARDVTVSLQNDIIKLLKAVLERDVKDSFTPELLQTAVVKVIENIGNDVELKFADDLEEDLANHIQQQLQKSNKLVDISKDNTLSKSLNITKKDQGWSYDVSPEAVTELLSSHLSSKWIRILKNGLE